MNQGFRFIYLSNRPKIAPEINQKLPKALICSTTCEETIYYTKRLTRLCKLLFRTAFDCLKFKFYPFLLLSVANYWATTPVICLSPRDFYLVAVIAAIGLTLIQQLIMCLRHCNASHSLNTLLSRRCSGIYISTYYHLFYLRKSTKLQWRLQSPYLPLTGEDHQCGQTNKPRTKILPFSGVKKVLLYLGAAFDSGGSLGCLLGR
jgi:hypothetical protein